MEASHHRLVPSQSTLLAGAKGHDALGKARGILLPCLVLPHMPWVRSSHGWLSC